MDARNNLSDERRKKLDLLAREIVRDSIVEASMSRLLSQVMAEVGEEINELKNEVSRLSHVRQTIYLNATQGMNCSSQQARAYADGTSEKTFVEALREIVDDQ